MNIPNLLTVLRLILVPIILLFIIPLPDVLLFENFNSFVDVNGNIIALLLFIIACITDFFDGYLARKLNQVTNLGKFLDPIADKLLTISMFVVFSSTGKIPVIFTIIIISREFLVTGLRLVAANQNIVISADIYGKIKTITQMIAIVLILSEKHLFNFNYISQISRYVLYFSVVITVYSGFNYIKNNMYIMSKFR